MSKKLSAKEVESILYPRKKFEDKVVELVEEATNIEIGEGIVFEIKDVVGDTKKHPSYSIYKYARTNQPMFTFKVRIISDKQGLIIRVL